MTTGILPNVNSVRLNRGVNSAQSAHFRSGRLRIQPNKRPKKRGDKSAVAIVKDVQQLGCVSQDVEPPESAAISRKGPKVLGPIRRLRFTRAALRQANIREGRGPSLNKIHVKRPHQRSPYAVKFEDRSQEETERRERCAVETRGHLPRISISSNKGRELHSFRQPVSGFCRPHPQ